MSIEPLAKKIEMLEGRVDMIESQLQTLNVVDVRVEKIEGQLLANTTLTSEIHADMMLTRDIHSWLEKGRGFFAVCGWIASALKYIVSLVILIAGALAVFTGKSGGGQP